MVERTCVVCRRRDSKDSLLGFSLLDGFYSVVLEPGMFGRCFHLHPGCFGNKKLLQALEHQLKRFACSVTDNSFFLDSEELIRHLQSGVESLDRECRFSLDKKKMAQEAVSYLERSLQKGGSSRLNTERKENQAKRKVRL